MMGGQQPDPDDQLSLLIEIVSCRDLLIADRKSSDPYVKVILGKKDLHKTKHLIQTLNPVYSSEHNNIFVWNGQTKELLENDGLEFRAKDWDRIGSNDELGTVQVTTTKLIEIANSSQEEGEEFHIVPPPKRSKEDAGYITIRISHATDEHRELYKAVSSGPFWNPSSSSSSPPADTTTTTTTTTPKTGEMEKGDVMEPPKLAEEKETEVETEAEQPDTTTTTTTTTTSTAAATTTTVEPPKPDEQIKLVIEIMSCRNLIAGDKKGNSDPYIKVHLGRKEVHKTKHVNKTLNPVFDEDTKSTFVLDVTAKDLLDANGLTLDVIDWDRGMIGKHDPLGNTKVSAEDLYSITSSDWEQQPKEYKISPPKGKENIDDAGYVKIRFRTATDDDIKHYKKGLFRGAASNILQAPSKIVSKTEGMVRTATEKVSPAKKTDRGLPMIAAIPDEDKELFIEIVSCRDLLAGDKSGTSDPYVKIIMGKKELHKTKHVLKTLNPSFTEKFNNFYVLDCSAKEDLFTNGGLQFKVRDWDRGIGGDDDLGSVFVPADTLYDYFEETKEFKIDPPKGKADEAGFITIRCRPATLGDRENLKKAKSPIGAILPESFNYDKESEDDHVDLMHLVDVDDKILLIEIVSCRDLLVADKTGESDPYVKIKMGRKDLHRTKHILKNLNPVFTEETNNSYVLDMPAMDLYGKKGIQLKVKDWDRGIGGDDDLGTVHIPADTLYNFGDEIKEFKLESPPGKSDDAGYISIRCTEIGADERDSRKKGFFGLKKKTTIKSRALDFSDLSLLIEIVSCQDLIKADLLSSDPYVKVEMGTDVVHETEYLDKTIDPIFTIKDGSLFILDVVKQEFSEGDGLRFVVKDYDCVGSNDELGHVQVNAKTLCEATGERMSLPLVPPMGSKKASAGKLNIRCRPATNYDRKFLEFSGGDKKRDFLGIDRMMDIVMNPSGGSKKLMKAKDSMIDGGVKKYRVRPAEDPERPAVTKWLTKEDIQAEAEKTSRKWIDIGSGTHGKLFVEVIGADGLPNLDTSVAGKDKTDAFAMLAYGDCCAKTDVIDDCLSPRWLPWMQRAYIMHVNHASSDIFVGLFDYDGSIGNHHDLIGRTTIELSSLEPNTEYMLSFNLYQDITKSHREKQGSVTLRVRVEYASPRELVLSNLQVPTTEYINVKKRKDFKLLKNTIGGDTDLAQYSLSTITLYVEELTSYAFLQYYIMDALESLFLWRGQVPFLFGFKIPLHSMIAFFAAITLAERPALWFSYFWFGHAWLLLAIQNYRNNTPNPWTKSKSFGQILCMLILNKAMGGSASIQPYQNEEEATKFENEFKHRIEEAEAKAEKRREEEMKILAEHEKETAELDQDADTDITTQNSGISIDPLKPFLYPIQGHLATVCSAVRFVRNIYIWHEPYYAFFLTAASLLVGVVFLLVPWAFLLRWIGRIVAWGAFGPHVKLVDIFYVKKLKKATDEEETAQLTEEYKAKLEQAKANDELAFVQTEDAVKLKAVKKMLYGKWIAKVPIINPERFNDLPLHSSYAKPYKPSEDSTRSLPIRISGQGLVGNMIPKLKDLAHAEKKKEAETKKEEKKEEAEAEIKSDETEGPTEKTPLLS